MVGSTSRGAARRGSKSAMMGGAVVALGVLVLIAIALSPAAATSVREEARGFARGDRLMHQGLEDLEFDQFLIRQVGPETCFVEPKVQEKVLFMNNSAALELSWVFIAEDEFAASDYTFEGSSNDPLILVPGSDTSISLVQNMDDPKNVTVTVSFEFLRCSGVLSYELTALRGGSPACSTAVEIIVAGICIYTEDAGEPTVRTGRTGSDPDIFAVDWSNILTQAEYTFFSRTQYLNGQNLTIGFPPVISVPLSGIDPVFAGATQLISYNPEVCQMDGGVYNGETVELSSDECGVTFTTNTVDGEWEGSFFGVRFNQYADGQILVLFNWEEFMSLDADGEFDDEVYQNFIVLNITGPAPPAVTEITPEGPFDSLGGEITTLYMLNVRTEDTVTLTVDPEGQALVYTPQSCDTPPCFTEPSVGVRVQNFIVAPGTGVDLPWRLDVFRADEGGEVQAVDLTQPPYLYDYFLIRALDPTVGPETGGITITGGANEIQNWDANRDYFLFGDIQVPSEYIISSEPFDMFYLEFELPPRFIIGADFVYDVSVVVDGVVVFLDQFTYLPAEIVVTIDNIGASRTGPKAFTIGACVPTEWFADIRPAFVLPSTTYRWTIFDVTDGVQVPIDNPTDPVLNFDGFFFTADHTYTFNLTATYVAKDADGNDVFIVGSDQVTVFKSPLPNIGVNILPPLERGVTDPNVPLRVQVLITIPDFEGCLEINDFSITYVWTYGNSPSQTFSANSQNIFPGGATPTKFGREYTIETSRLIVGDTEISCVATLDENPSITGMDTESITVRELPLRALVNGGVARIDGHSTDANLFLTGALSYDPNVADFNDATAGLTYRWTCSSGPDLGSLELGCGSAAVPTSTARENSVSAASLASALGGADELFIVYTLTVSKNARPSGSFSTAVQVVSSGGSQSGSPAVQVSNSLNQLVDLSKVGFYEDIQITPLLLDEDAAFTVSYEILAPVEDAGRIADFAAVLPGYWDPNNPDTFAPLLIRAGSMVYGTTYVFEVTFTVPGRDLPTVFRVQFNTIGRPSFEVLKSADEGTTFTDLTMRAIASADYGADYIYSFFIEQDGQATCVSGCVGYPLSYFRIQFTGTYTLIVQMMDARGIAVVLERNVGTLVISESPNGGAPLGSAEFNKLFVSGAANQYSTNTYLLTTFQLQQQSTVTSRMSLPDTAQMQRQSAELADVVAGLRSIVAKTVPGPEEGSNFVTTFANTMRLAPVFLPDLSTVYDLWFSTRLVVQNTAENEVLRILDPAERLMNYSRKHVFTATTTSTSSDASSSRTRLVERQETPSLNGAVLDWAELTQYLFVAQGGRSSACGSESFFTTAVEDGDPAQPSDLGYGDFLTVRTAVSCNAGQISSIVASQSLFEWDECSAIYSAEDPESRRIFALSEGSDWIYASGVQGGNLTYGSVLVNTGVASRGPNGGLLPLGETNLEDCTYVVRINKGVVPDNVDAVAGALLRPPKPLQQDTITEFQYYNQVDDATSTLLENDDLVRFSSRNVGAFQLRAADVIITSTPSPVTSGPVTTSPGGAGGLSGGAIAGIVVGILIFIIIAVVVVWLITTRCLLVTATPPPALEPDETFVERDVYGRSMWAYEIGMDSTLA
ncbi:hypothetical protein FVE85_7276 [Porphyridium purpureum]|uniref:PKD/REJ-like domain-containing protein n=1 Tax=Porphyridium purpureum TaxID=35688 RepID=A0A5J4Z6Z9_PORPP|nr:hypothetical protein FVE85_7276 [Porphyridium purpureum]|eukprot:POR6879..scf295_1